MSVHMFVHMDMAVHTHGCRDTCLHACLCTCQMCILSKMCPDVSPHRFAAAELEAQHENVADNKVSATMSKSIGVESGISAPPTLQRSVAHV